MPMNARATVKLRQLSRRGDSSGSSGWSKRWSHCKKLSELGDGERELCRNRKNVMVVVDASPEAKIAMLWALSNLVNNLDTLILLHVIHTTHLTASRRADGSSCANYLRSLCKAGRPEVDVQAVVIQAAEKAATIVNQANKLHISVLILGQRRPSLLHRFLRKKDELVDYCIDHAECLTLGVSKQSSSIGGYLINSKWHKNFWLLA
ncbi:hypothetical protein SUGI_1026150 [Cryptomeria japonica]|uniref:uncharacterized protein LOC131040911 n=1 Tax=Cryptomeria japonica TaxID=3369 RepID=UPI002414948E|nr:uncharacterized protein LOC131040911 [Cryptomeria japonica]GLJ48640.1 hypothetical protein SUGI_1026150 [Cryptomeria japonica]